MSRFIGFVIAALALSACNGQETPPAVHSVTIMTFNVENLFDAIDDPEKDDRDYLPIAQKQTEAHRAACAELRFDSWRNRCLTVDWSESIVQRKLAAVARAVLQVDGGRGPDLIALQEVENIGILERLRTEYLESAGYLPGILIEGNDSRGIDLAFLSRLPLAGEPRLHGIVFDESLADRTGDTRGILQADFELPDGAILTGFAVHFPAPYHPTEMRIAAYDTLNSLVEALPEDRVVVAAGDFNTTSAEDAEKNMLDRFARTRWLLSNDFCDACLGTAYYAPDDSWSFLDMILVRPGSVRGARATWDLRETSVRIANESGDQCRDDGTPWRFQLPDGAGVSDHWPVVLTLESK